MRYQRFEKYGAKEPLAHVSYGLSMGRVSQLRYVALQRYNNPLARSCMVRKTVKELPFLHISIILSTLCLPI